MLLQYYKRLFYVLFLSQVLTAHAQEVVLNPGFISGTVRVGNEQIRQIELSAFSAPYSSRATVTPLDDITTESYTLTVNVPEGTVREYALTKKITTSGESGFSTVFSIGNELINVTEQNTSISDFIINNPGYIEGAVITEGGGIIHSAQASASHPQVSFSATAKSQYRIPFPAENNISFNCSGRVSHPDGGPSVRVNGEVQMIDMLENETLFVNCILPTPDFEAPEVGTATAFGTFNLSGSMLPRADFHSATLTLGGSTSIPGDASDYEIRQLVPRSYNFNATSAFDEFRVFNRPTFPRILQYPFSTFSPASTHPAGYVYQINENTENRIDINAQLESIIGRMNVTGSGALANYKVGHIHASGIAGTATERGFSQDISGNSGSVQLDPESYELIVTEGPWQLPDMSIDFEKGTSDPNEYLKHKLGLNYEESFTPVVNVSLGQPLIYDFDLPTGEAIILFRIAGNPNTVMSRPNLSGQCKSYTDNNELVYTYGLNSNNPLQQDVSIGQVRVIGLAGTCKFNTFAFVNGSSVSFGELVFDMVPGTTQVIDIGGPTLVVQTPEPDILTSNNIIEVSGLVTDESGVDSVTVNGVEAVLTSTNNPDDPRELSFTIAVPLLPGNNSLETIATDSAGNTSKDTRMVALDSALPTIEWTPITDSQFPSEGSITKIEVSGIADDDSGIQSITIQGELVNFISTGNSDNPNEVSFLTILDLVDGTNFINVVVTDISGRQVMQTHRVEIVTNLPPTVDAGPDLIVEQQTPQGATVTITGSSANDPDGDEITFQWRGAIFSTELFPEVFLTPGEHIAFLFAFSLGDSASDTVTITVRDTTPPELIVPANIDTDAEGNLTVVDLGTATAIDVADLDVQISNDAPAAFSIGETLVTWTATDAAGNSSTATQLVTINNPIDETPPVITAPNNIETEAIGELTPVEIGTATAIDDVDGELSVSNDAPSKFPLGETVVTWMAEDSSGNVGTATQTVTVVDTTAPEFTVNKVREVLYWYRHKHKYHSHRHKLTTVISGVIDTVDSAPIVEITVTGNQPHYYYKKTNYKIRMKNGTWKVKLRPEINHYAENPGIYTIRITATDASGNSKTIEYDVAVKPLGRPYHHHSPSHHKPHYGYRHYKGGHYSKYSKRYFWK